MSGWKHSLNKTRYVMDVLLLVFFVLANIPQISLPFHEWVSFVYIVPFFIHLLLHYDWALEVPGRFFKKLGGEVRFNFVFDICLHLMMIFVIVSGILASEIVLPMFMDFQAQPFWTQVHHSYSNLLMVMVGVHLGMHWRWIKGLTRTMFSSKNSAASSVEPDAG